MTVFELITQLKAFTAASPMNGAAKICLRSEDGETCFPHFSGLNFSGSKGQKFFVLAPENVGKFRAIDKMNLI